MHCEDTTHFVEDCRGRVRQCDECGDYACEVSISLQYGRWLCAHCLFSMIDYEPLPA
jgi:formylmethanofuran dehydrogenase subunit E